MTDKDKFVANLYPAAVKVSQETGMSKELILAQAAQETGWGQHILAGTHNIFNIKASANWTGPTKSFRVWEIEDGLKIWKNQDFRVYGSTEEALRDRVKFLQDNHRYTKAGLFDDGTKGDFAKEAAALQEAGYATDPLYARHLIGVYYSPTMQKAIGHTLSRADDGILEQGDSGEVVRTLQTALATLGNRDAHDPALKADGDFGPSTRSAVETFQREHHLLVDGKVGARTRRALDLAMRQRESVAVIPLDDLRHPDHLLYQQALAGVHRVDAQLGRHPDTHSENLAVALTVAARRQDLDRIDQVMLSGDGERAFVLQDGLWARMAHVQTADAVRTSVIDSSVAWTQAHQQAVCLNPPMPVPAAASTPTNVHAVGR